MDDVSEIWLKEMEDGVRGIERLILAAAERTESLEDDPLLSDRKRSVTALRNQLRKLAGDAASLREEFSPRPVEVEESVDTDLMESVTAARNGEGAAAEVD